MAPTQVYIPAMPYLGETAAILTAVLWAVTSIFFAESGKRIGSFRVNNIRLLMAVGIYAIILTVIDGVPYPRGVNSMQLFWLGLSGFVGLVVGDGCGFKALVMIGPRLTTLMYSTTPIWTTIVAWIFLGEQLTWYDLLGIAATFTGVAWVVTERRYNNVQKPVEAGHPDSGSLLKGVLLGMGAAIGQAVGLVMAKQGMLYAGGIVEPIQASAIRMAVGMVLIWTISTLRGQLPGTLRAMKDIRAVGFTFGGSFFGPFLGVWMSLLAVRLIEAGIASTLNSMSPVMILPLMVLVYKEKPSVRAWLGAILAVGGAALLFLS